MIGVVLCGGQSTRMGSDKGLLKKANLTWAEIAASKLSALQLPVVISVNEDQLQPYSEVFKSEHLIVDDGGIQVKGPLLGLLSVHYQFPEEDLFVLASDMIDMDEQLLHDLFVHYRKGSNEAYVYVTEEKLQPLCGIYTSKGLKRIDHLLQRQQLKKFSMAHVLGCMVARCLSAAKEFEYCFANYNYPEAIK